MWLFLFSILFHFKIPYRAYVCIQDRVRSKENSLHVCGWGNFPAHNHCPKWTSFTTQLIGDLPLLPGSPGASRRRSLQPFQARALCGWRAGGRVCWGSAWGPVTIYMSMVKPKLLQFRWPGPLWAARPWVLSLSLLHRALKMLAASRHLANSLGGICHPLQALSLGKYISNLQAGFSNDPRTPRWERWML